jgi:hypothetical protein
MPRRPRDPEFLREKAHQFRELAEGCNAFSSAKMLALADELDAMAAEVEKRPDRRQ